MRTPARRSGPRSVLAALAAPARAALPLLAAAAAAVLLVAPAPAAAQQGGGAADAGGGAAEERAGWLGVGLQETLVCPRDGEAPVVVTPENCRRAYVAEAVFEESPAAAAGVQPGDTLIALNGRPLASRRGARVLRAMEPGSPVELLLGRDGGRESVRVVPAPRPPEAGRVTLRTPPAPAAAGTVRVAPGVVIRWSRSLGGVEAPEAAVHEASRAALRIDRQGRVYLQGEGRELVRLRGVEADRIRSLRDSVMREVRERLERMLRERRAEGEAPDAPDAPPSAPLRLAGAEFRPLGPGPAARVEGVDRGLLVRRVVPETPADELGLRPGDVVVEAAGEPTARPEQLRSALRRLARGDSVVVRWVREGRQVSGTLRPR